jgi:hypothetical protein
MFQRLSFIQANRLALLFVSPALAQSPTFAPRSAIAPKPKKVGACGASPRGTLEKGVVKEVVRAKVAFTPLTVDDINGMLKKAHSTSGARGKAKQIILGGKISVGPKDARGKQKEVSIEEYMAQLNVWVQKFADKGLNPHTHNNKFEVEALDMEDARLEQQRVLYQAKMKKIGALKVPFKPAFLKVRRKRGARGAKKVVSNRLLAGAPEYEVDAAAGKVSS